MESIDANIVGFNAGVSSPLRNYSCQWNNSTIGLSLVTIPVILCLVMMIVVVMDFVRTYWLRPGMIKRIMARQGVLGPAPSFVMGNLREMGKMREQETSNDMTGVTHDIVSRLLPHYVRWSKIYGTCLFPGIIRQRIAQEILIIKATVKSYATNNR